jgi:two-component system chemotaxis response regulator CheY
MSAKILIVDDSSLTRRTLRSLVESMGYTAEDAVDGTQALERFFIGKPDVVLLDIVMSGMYGPEVLEKLKELDPEVRVVVCTSDIQKSTAEQIKAAGAKGILNKPISKEQLAAVLQTVLAGGTAWN